MDPIEQVVEKGRELAVALDAAQKLPDADKHPALVRAQIAAGELWNALRQMTHHQGEGSAGCGGTP